MRQLFQCLIFLSNGMEKEEDEVIVNERIRYSEVIKWLFSRSDKMKEVDTYKTPSTFRELLTNNPERALL